MPHLALPATLRRAVSSALILGAASIAACGRADETPRVDTALPDVSGGPRPITACTPRWGGRIETISRDSVLAWAGQLDYRGHDTTRARLYGFEAGAGAEIHSVEGLDPAGICLPTGRGCIIARVVTNVAHATLGIAVGRNYVWADSAGGSARAVIIPENRAAPVVVHRLQHHRFSPGGPPPARRLAAGSCEWCGDSCWCDWPTDTTRGSILRLRGDTDLVRSGSRRP